MLFEANLKKYLSKIIISGITVWFIVNFYKSSIGSYNLNVMSLHTLQVMDKLCSNMKYRIIKFGYVLVLKTFMEYKN